MHVFDKRYELILWKERVQFHVLFSFARINQMDAKLSFPCFSVTSVQHFFAFLVSYNSSKQFIYEWNEMKIAIFYGECIYYEIVNDTW